MSTDRSELDNRVVVVNSRGGDYPRAIFGSCDGCGVLIVADALREILTLAKWKIGDPRIEVEIRADLGWNTGTEEQLKRNPYKLVSARQVLGLNVPYFKHLSDKAKDGLAVVINEMARSAYPDAPCVLAIEAHVNALGISRTLNPKGWDEAYDAAHRRVRDYRLAVVGANLPEAIASQMPAIREFLDGELSQLDIAAILNPPQVEEELEPEPERPDGREILVPPGWPKGEELGEDEDVDIELGPATDLAEPVHPHEDLTEGAEGLLRAFAHQPTDLEELHDGAEDSGRKTVKRGNNGKGSEPATG